MISSMVFMASLTKAPDVVQLKLIPSGMTAKIGGYRPIRSEFGETATAKPASGLSAPKYGTIDVAGKKIAYVIDEPVGKPATLIFDRANDGDLSNDTPIEWKPQTNGGTTVYFGSAQLSIGKSDPVTINMYRFDPNDAQRAALKSTLLYYYDYGYELSFTLDGKPFTSVISGEPSAGMVISIDRNGDGKITQRKESIVLGKPFNFTGTTMVLDYQSSGMTLTKSATKVPLAPMPVDFTIGKKTVAISGVATDGTKVDLFKDYKGKLVMLDFWATWCGPCVAELPNVKAAYAKYHDQGFEVLGISFDNENMAEKLKEFTSKNEMPWRQIYEGKGWETVIGTSYDVDAIPFTLLIDGDTGKIVADETSLRGPGLSAFIEKQLAAKKAKK